MSLDTLLEAAKFLDTIENGDASINTNACDINGQYVVRDLSYDTDSSHGKYHLKVDPNLPISVQFHTYSSSVGTDDSSVTLSTKRNAHHTDPMANHHGRPSVRGGNNSKDKDHSSYSKHREMHKTLEKNRRAHLRNCFEILKEVLPFNEYNEKKTSHINIIRCAIKCIQQLKRAESEHEYEFKRLTRAKIHLQNQLTQLKEDFNESVKNIKDEVNWTDTCGADRSKGERPKDAAIEIVQYDVEIDEHSDGDVIIEFEAGEEFDDETTTTASECAEDLRDTANGSKLNGSLTSSNALLYQIRA